MKLSIDREHESHWMFDKLKSFFSADGLTAIEENPFGSDDMRLAEAALMFHVIVADGKVTDSETAKMKDVLKRHYDLEDTQFNQLFIAAEQAEQEAVDLYRFTSLLKRHLDRTQRIAIVERLWEMVFADGKMHEFEDNVVWRMAQLLEVETQDRIAMKQQVRSRQENET
jgi:uncharacterized tellurite resistance protein B-like protein